MSDLYGEALKREREAMERPCPDCSSTHAFLHERGCLTLARIQREQLRGWRAEGDDPGPRWAAREAEIERQLGGTDAA